MNIILLGYMASGKSLIGEKLKKILDRHFYDLDNYIESRESMCISEIFSKKGEIYFRKIESKYLQNLLTNDDNAIISLGGGTPCYGNNMDVIKNNKNTHSIYLQVSVSELSNRLLSENGNRPLVSHITDLEDMNEYVGKHLFERMAFYNQADVVVNANSNTEKVIENILLTLF